MMLSDGIKSTVEATFVNGLGSVTFRPGKNDEM